MSSNTDPFDRVEFPMEFPMVDNKAGRCQAHREPGWKMKFVGEAILMEYGQNSNL